jgi:hypothetical protein
MEKPTYEELQAQVEVLRQALEPFTATGLSALSAEGNYTVAHHRIKEWLGFTKFKRLIEACNQTPAACLAQVRAEAGRAGYQLGAEQWCFNQNEMQIDIERAANQHAERIRQGGAK